jgi:dipeptidyl aminopeptidase/acylaminoacyl peptidase
VRRLVVLLLVILVVGGAYLGASAMAWSKVTATDTSCMTLHADQTPANFTATWGDKGPTVDATPYRFTDAKEVSFPSLTPGLTIRGWWAPPTDPKAGVVIVVHGKLSCRHDPVNLLPAGMVHRSGLGVLLIYLRNHGTSDVEDGHWAGGADEWQDVLGAWQWLRGRGYAANSIGALGLSMGAGAVSLAMGHEPQLAAAFLDSPYADIVQMSVDVAGKTNQPAFLVPGALFMGQVIAGDNFLGDSPERAFAERLNGRPVDIVHGTADQTIPVEQGKQLARAAARGGTPVVPWILDGVQHVQSAFVKPAEYERRVTAFFRDHLAPSTP